MKYRRYLVKNVKTGKTRTVLVPLDGKKNALDYLKNGDKIISVVGQVDKDD